MVPGSLLLNPVTKTKATINQYFHLPPGDMARGSLSILHCKPEDIN